MFFYGGQEEKSGWRGVSRRGAGGERRPQGGVFGAECLGASGVLGCFGEGGWRRDERGKVFFEVPAG